MNYSFVVPIFNDGALAREFCREIATTFRAYLGHDDLAREVEVIFVDDGSANDSPQLLKQVCDEYPFAKLVLLSRNFGQHIAISAGYRAASGKYVGMLNVDQEDPPRNLPQLIDALRQSECDIAGGRYERRSGPIVTRATSYLFHTMLNRLTGYKTPVNGTTMRVMTRRSVDVYNSLTENSRYLPGLEMWLGLRYVWVQVERQSRRAGKSSYNFRRRLRMAIASIISFSDFPLRLAVKVGFAMAMLGMLIGGATVTDKLFFHNLLPGYTSTIAITVFLGGIQIVVTGIASLYIGRILAEVQGRPLFVVREIYGGKIRQLREPVLDVREGE
jgi:glycosyltransferase involved in cell wall biosynthesis